MSERHITFDGPDGLRYDPRVHGFIEPDGARASDERVTAAWDKHDATRRREVGMFDFNQRVYLRRDPSQFGRIGVTGQSFDPSAATQAVFWEHTGGDVVTVEPVADLMGEEERHSQQKGATK